ncbi:MAG TPA: PEP/pyruvate-binding domain-containing protein [Pirellulaceae bacterium]|jgi:pyruvate,water dikinase|nr:PEP/pyruvate-binding domain-containing protein [Pirellulaceae bacterium]
MTTTTIATQLRFIRKFEEISIEDIPLVGGKNASLGEMCRELRPEGINLADGFAITAEAYRYFLEEAGLANELRDILSDLDVRDIENLQQRGRRVRHAILGAELPADLQREITAGYAELCEVGERADVAVRSSATAEDLPDASFAGQQETYLNVQGDAALLETCRRCFASLFTDRAISYREDKAFDHFQVALSIGVQRMVRSDLGSSGVMFSIDTETGFRDVVAHVFDERNEAVKKMIAQAIRAAHDKGRKIGICGQAPSDYPEFAQFLVEQGIDSISLTPDAVVKTSLSVLEIEKSIAGVP